MVPGWSQSKPVEPPYNHTYLSWKITTRLLHPPPVLHPFFEEIVWDDIYLVEGHDEGQPEVVAMWAILKALCQSCCTAWFICSLHGPSWSIRIIHIKRGLHRHWYKNQGDDHSSPHVFFWPLENPTRKQWDKDLGYLPVGSSSADRNFGTWLAKPETKPVKTYQIKLIFIRGIFFFKSESQRVINMWP